MGEHKFSDLISVGSEDSITECDDGWCGSIIDIEDELAGGGEVVGEVCDEFLMSAAEAIDGLPVIAEEGDIIGVRVEVL